MKISKLGVNFIKACEGLRLDAYLDTAGVRTIGYGHAYWEGKNKITESEAYDILKQDLEKFEKIVEKYHAQYKWSQNEFDALVSFAFNLGGIGQLTAGATRTKKEIAEKMLLYVNSGGKKVAGLEKRRLAEQKIFLEGKYLKDPYSEDLRYIEPEPTHTKDTKTGVKEVLKGLHGVGDLRKKSLECCGFDVDSVQEAVNAVYSLKDNVGDLKKLKRHGFSLKDVIEISGGIM